MKKMIFYLTIGMLCLTVNLNSQKTIITDDPAYTNGEESAMLDVKSTSKGFLPPRMTVEQRDVIAIPAEGLIISCTDCQVPGLHQYINGTWIALAHSSFSTGNYATVVNPATGKIWLDRNLGASQVATSSTDTDSYGDLYQWGRGADGHHVRTSGITTVQATNWFSGDGSWNGLFIISYSNWLNDDVPDLWSGTAAKNNPCPSGFRIPTNAEWNQERLTWISNNAAGAFASPLKLPMAGYRDYSSGSLSGHGGNGYYWTGTVSSSNSRLLHFFSSNAYVSCSIRAYGRSLRCIKD